MGRINVAYAIFEGPLGPNKSGTIIFLKACAAKWFIWPSAPHGGGCCPERPAQRLRCARILRLVLRYVQPSPFEIFAVASPRAHVQTSLRKGQ